MTTTDHPYVAACEQYGRTVWEFDGRAFVAALAPLLGEDAKIEEADRYGGKIVLGGLTLYLRSERGARLGRVAIGAGLPEIERKLQGSRYGLFPKITVDSSRPLDKLALDVTRRVIDPSLTIGVTLMAQLGDQLARRAECERHGAAIRARWPAASVTFKEERDTTARLYLAGVSATLAHDGGLYIDRLGRVDSARTMALLAALADPIADEG